MVVCLFLLTMNGALQSHVSFAPHFCVQDPLNNHRSIGLAQGPLILPVLTVTPEEPPQLLVHPLKLHLD